MTYSLWERLIFRFTGRWPASVVARRLAEVDAWPRLSYNLPRGYVQARNTLHGAVLIGGLGSLGAGAMWKPETENDRTRDGYDDAPEQKLHPSIIELVEEWRAREGGRA